MRHLDAIRRHCLKYKEISQKVIDDFLLYYAGEKDKLSNLFDRKIKKHKKAAAEIHQSTINMMKSQFIVHKVFKKEGLIHKYLNHSAIKDLVPEKYNFLKEQAKVPWRFSYGNIVGNPAQDFYEILDEFTEEKYLLFSPGLTKTIEDFPGTEFIFNLIAFNGKCYETYGPIGGFNSLDGDDIFYFATLKNSQIAFDDDILQDIEKDPLPYCLLISSMGLPDVIGRGYEMALHRSMDYLEDIDLEKLKSNFSVRKEMGVYRFTLDEIKDFPHFAKCYFDTKSSEFLATADTAFGYDEMQQALKNSGVEIPEISDIKVHLGILPTFENVLNRKITTDPYATIFNDEAEDADIQDTDLESVNEALGEMVESINSRKKIDFETLSKNYGVEVETLKSIAIDLYSKLGLDDSDMKG